MGNLSGDATADKYSPEGQELKVKTIGLQIGENLHEKISEDGLYSNEAELNYQSGNQGVNLLDLEEVMGLQELEKKKDKFKK